MQCQVGMNDTDPPPDCKRRLQFVTCADVLARGPSLRVATEFMGVRGFSKPNRPFLVITRSVSKAGVQTRGVQHKGYII